jgi:hypothetical protein
LQVNILPAKETELSIVAIQHKMYAYVKTPKYDVHIKENYSLKSSFVEKSGMDGG